MLQDSSFEKSSDQREKASVIHPPGDLTHELIVVYSVERYAKLLQIHIHDIPVSASQMPLWAPERLTGTAPRPEAKASLRKRLVPLGLQYLQNRLLDQWINRGGHS